MLLSLTLSIPGHAASNTTPDSRISVSSGMMIERLVVKFDESLRMRLRNGAPVSLSGIDTDGLAATLNDYTLKPLFLRSETELDNEYMQLSAIAPDRAVDKNSYFQIEVTDHFEAEWLVNLLSSMPQVETVYLEPQAEPAQDIPPPTPDLSGSQGYLYGIPEGIAADFAWTIPGGTGAGINVIDIEGNWNFEHEDFGDNVGELLAGDLVPHINWINHGTAVLGVIVGDSNEYGITGIAYDAHVDMASTGGIGVAAAVDISTANLQAGDVLIIELHTPGPRYDFQSRPDQMGYVPMEYFQANFDAIQMATAKGIIVVAAAGNGYEDLDDPIYEDLFDKDFRNSRAILVGAGAPPGGEYGLDRSKLYFSNFGSRVDLQGWGKNVVTTGYGGLFSGDGDMNQYYTETFGGTSSATPIVAGAVICLQGIYNAQYGFPMAPEVVLSLLANTGSQQPNPSEWIGPRPNLEAAYQFLPPPGLIAEPTYLEHIVLGGQVASNHIILTNSDSAASASFSININDTLEGLGNPGWLMVDPATGTIDPGGEAILFVTLDSAPLDDTTYNYKGIINVDYGTWYEIAIPVFLTVACNDTDYVTIDSDDPIGPDFEWIEISQIGTRVALDEFHNTYRPNSSLDDGTSLEIPIGFPFNFYNDVFTSLHVGVNGGISFTSDEVNILGYFADIDFPSPGIDALLLPFWNDLTIDTVGAGHGSIYYYTTPAQDSMIIEYHQIGNFGHDADSMITFEVILTSDHRISYQYLDVGLYDLGYTSVIGISRDEGCRMNKYFSAGGGVPENFPHDFLRVDFIPQFDMAMQSGDLDGSGEIDIDDVVFLVNYIFGGGPAPIPLEAGDCDCSDNVDIDDVVYLINYIFAGGPLPCTFNY